MTTDWPVAQIPTTPSANHPAGRVSPLRWPHHGDLRVLVDEPDVFIAALDLHRLAGIGEGAKPHPMIIPAVTWAKQPGDDLVAFYTLAEAVAVLEYSSTDLAVGLLEFMRVHVAALLEAFGAQLAPFTSAYTFRQAARILDADPAVSIGRQSLFTHLEHIGWIERDLAGLWRALPTALHNHWLTVRTVTVRAGKTVEPYPQLYVTQAGIAMLRRSLRSLHPDAPATTPAPPELDLAQ